MMEAKSERGSSRRLALQAWPTLKRCDEGALLAGLESVCILGHDAIGSVDFTGQERAALNKLTMPAVVRIPVTQQPGSTGVNK